MGAPRTITDETRRAVEDDLRARWGPVGLRVIAAAHGISEHSTRRIAAAAGITAEGARAATKSAAQSHRERNAKLREELSERLLREAQRALDDIDAGSVVTGVSFGTVVSGRAGATSARDRQALLTAAGIALDKHRMLDTYDQDRDTTEIGKFLRALAGGDAS